jgi:hypothetical protein
MLGIWIDPACAGIPKDQTVLPDRIIHSLPELLDGEHEKNDGAPYSSSL